MADSIYTRALARAAEIQGSTQALASILRVPESTLLRWLAGRAQMPLAAFVKVIEIVSAEERKQAPDRQAAAHAQKLRFKLVNVEAHCARCDGVEFVQADPTLPTRYINELVCCTCGERVIHGNLIARLARDSVQHSKRLIVGRKKRQAELARKLGQQTQQPAPRPSPQQVQRDD